MVKLGEGPEFDTIVFGQRMALFSDEKAGKVLDLGLWGQTSNISFPCASHDPWAPPIWIACFTQG